MFVRIPFFDRWEKTTCKDKSEQLIRFIDELGYKMYWHMPALFNPNNWAGNPVNYFGQLVSANMLCVPKKVPQEVSGLRPVEVSASHAKE